MQQITHGPIAWPITMQQLLQCGGNRITPSMRRNTTTAAQQSSTKKSSAPFVCVTHILAANTHTPCFAESRMMYRANTNYTLPAGTLSTCWPIPGAVSAVFVRAAAVLPDHVSCALCYRIMSDSPTILFEMQSVHDEVNSFERH